MLIKITYPNTVMVIYHSLNLMSMKQFEKVSDTLLLKLINNL